MDKLKVLGKTQKEAKHFPIWWGKKLEKVDKYGNDDDVIISSKMIISKKKLCSSICA